MSRSGQMSASSPAFVVLLIYLASTYATVLLPEDLAVALTREDGFFEIVGALGFLVGAILFAAAFRRAGGGVSNVKQAGFKRLTYLLLALLFFFGAGEEISWGQRILGLETPEVIVEVNTQDETTVHNLDIFEEGGMLYFIRLRRLFNVFWMVFAVLIPFAALVHGGAAGWLNARVPVAPWLLAPLFLANYAVWKSLWLTDPYYDVVVESIEIAESNFAVLLAVVASQILREASGVPPDPESPG